ncbi:MAG: gamma-glutamyltransferase [Bdellovibrionales bacterium]|nr:gamma-glutamyltransferase [Bdellovibrionales bacterium]
MSFRRLLFGFLTLAMTLQGASSFAIPAEGSKMMIAAPSPYAVEVGKKIIEDGGNVIDVAVAVGLTLAVTSPYYAALGGGGFALIKMNDKVEVLDFREVAPQATGPKFYLDKAENASRDGGTAVGVPGFPAGLYEMHKKYGKIKWSKLFHYPLQLAQDGFAVSGEWASNTEDAAKRFNNGGIKHFTYDNGKLYRPGQKLKQYGLAKALKEFRRSKNKGFYDGVVAKDIVDTVKRTGGVMELSDLKNYKVRWLEPLTTQFLGYKVYLMPPPSSGGVVIKSALNLMEKLNLNKQKPLSVDELHLMGEILARSFRGRALLGDPDFHSNPLDLLLSDKYLSKMAKSINLKKSTKLSALKTETAVESSETTHYSVMDAKGNAISLTVTLNGNYGSAVVSNRFGVALNNEMDDFTTRPGEPNMFGLIQGMGNSVQPGKRPLSSMSPTLVEKDGKIVMTLGAPGGPRIISGTLQTLYRVLANGWDMDKAIQAPRVHHQFLPHTLFVDKDRFSPDVLDLLRKRGHEIKETWIARVVGVRLNEKGNLEAAFDSRGEGAAGGY